MRCVIVKQPLGINRIAGQAAIGQLCIEPRVLNDARASNVVWMCIFKVRSKDHLRTECANDCSNFVTCLHRVRHRAVWEVKRDSFCSKNARSVGRLFGTLCPITKRSWFAIGEIKKQDAMPLRNEASNGSAHGKFLIVGMWSCNKNVHI